MQAVPKAPWGTLGVSLGGVPLRRELLARGSAVATGRSWLGPWGFGLAAVGPRVTQRH